MFEIVLKHLAAEPPKATISCNFLPDNKQAIPLDVVRKLFGIMHNLKIKPSPTAYAAALEALSKLVVSLLCIRRNNYLQLIDEEIKKTSVDIYFPSKGCGAF